jgi:hypothetical protein
MSHIWLLTGTCLQLFCNRVERAYEQGGQVLHRLSALRSFGALAIVVCLAGLPLACDGDEAKVTPDQRDARRVVAAASDVLYQCLAVEAGYTNRVDSRQVARDVDYLVSAWDRLRPDSRFRTQTGSTTLRQQSRVAVRRLEAGCAPKEAARLDEAMEE